MIMALAIAALAIGILSIYEAHYDAEPAIAGLGYFAGTLCIGAGIGGILVAIFV